MLTDPAIVLNDSMSSGSATSSDRRIDSIASLCGILGPITCIVLGIALRLDTFLGKVSLSTDEAAFARNIIDRPWTTLLGPLDFAQIAPPGFVLVETAMVSMFGPGEYALRV